MNEEKKIVIYQTEDGQTQIDVRLENDTVWLTQAQMAELFETDRTSIVRHINNIYRVDELGREATCASSNRREKTSYPYYPIFQFGYDYFSRVSCQF